MIFDSSNYITTYGFNSFAFQARNEISKLISDLEGASDTKLSTNGKQERVFHFLVNNKTERDGGERGEHTKCFYVTMYPYALEEF